jgi:protein-tyrosine phosphatase
VRFEDVGGQRVVTGGLVVLGSVYRIGGSLVSDDDLDVLDTLTLRTIIDLRGSGEDRSVMQGFAAQRSIKYRHIPIQVASVAQLASVPSSVEGARAFMERVYRELVETHGPQLAAAISALDSPSPIGVGCAAGKDRTGVLVALLHETLGVPREVALAEYVRCAPNPALVGERLVQLLPAGHQVTPGFRYILEPQPAALLAALTWIDATYDGVEGYLIATGVELATIDRLRRTMVLPRDAPKAG